MWKRGSLANCSLTDLFEVDVWEGLLDYLRGSQRGERWGWLLEEGGRIEFYEGKESREIDRLTAWIDPGMQLSQVVGFAHFHHQGRATLSALDRASLPKKWLQIVITPEDFGGYYYCFKRSLWCPLL